MSKDLKLTYIEEKIIACLTKGLSNKDIAKSLHFSESTIKNYISILLQRYGCKNRLELTMKFLESKGDF